MGVIHYKVVSIHESGDSYLDAVLLAIRKAQKTVYVESYIFELPDPGMTLLTALEEASQKGLEIKVLVDGVGSLHHLKTLQEWSDCKQIPIKIYNPLPWRRRWRVVFFPLFLLNLVWHTRTLNRRDHRKMILIDGYRAFLGSINFSTVHFSQFNTNPWFDLAVEIEGESVQFLEREYLKTFHGIKPSPVRFWKEVKLEFHHSSRWFPLEQKIRLNKNFFWRFLFWRDFLRRIRKAKQRVFIMNAYFVPHRTLIRSLAVAARQGVSVVLLLPSVSDVPVVKWLAPMYYRELLKKGIQIYEMQNRMIHAKSVLVDDWALIGSNNLNYRSLIHDLEVDVVIDEAWHLKKLEQVWLNKIKESQPINLQLIEKLSWWHWIRYRLVLLIRYFI